LDEFIKPENKENKIITVSRFSEEKNLEFALKVLSSIDVNYNLIGNTKTKANVLHYEHLLKKINTNPKIKILRNISRDEIIRNYKTAKVYFHASPETFGITIIESIAAGCIPIVPDNSAHIETVPFSELRYIPNDFNDATDKIKRAMKGEFNHLVESLQKTIPKYGKENFKKVFIEYIEKL
jgi:glycosyltransferase involved in cell wall biosynthesis